MKLHLSNPNQGNFVKSCTSVVNGGFQLKIDETIYTHSLILTFENIELWPVREVTDLKVEDFYKLTRIDCEVVLLGTKGKIQFPPKEMTRPLIHSGIGLEVMDTPAACRTYNMLAGDDRKVIAALIL